MDSGQLRERIKKLEGQRQRVAQQQQFLAQQQQENANLFVSLGGAIQELQGILAEWEQESEDTEE